MTTGSTGIGAETGDLAKTILSLRALRRETVRREILDEGRIDLLASHLLRYQVQPFHLEMLNFQSEAKDTCLQLAPRGFGKSTILTITRAVFEIIRNPMSAPRQPNRSVDGWT